MTPSICQGVEEQAGYQVCQEMLIFRPVLVRLGRACAIPPNCMTRWMSSSTVSGLLLRTATWPRPAGICMHSAPATDHSKSGTRPCKVARRFPPEISGPAGGGRAACYNWPAMEFRQSPRPRPHDWRRHRRLEWLMIYLPLILGLFGLVGLGMLLGRAQVASASTWADAGLVLLLVVALGPALVLLVLVLGLAAGLWYLVRWLPLPMERGREWVSQSAAVGPPRRGEGVRLGLLLLGLLRQVTELGSQPE